MSHTLREYGQAREIEYQKAWEINGMKYARAKLPFSLKIQNRIRLNKKVNYQSDDAFEDEVVSDAKVIALLRGKLTQMFGFPTETCGHLSFLFELAVDHSNTRLPFVIHDHKGADAYIVFENTSDQVLVETVCQDLIQCLIAVPAADFQSEFDVNYFLEFGEVGYGCTDGQPWYSGEGKFRQYHLDKRLERSEGNQ